MLHGVAKKKKKKSGCPGQTQTNEIRICNRQNNASPAPQVVHILILRTCEYVTLHGKREFADGESILDYQVSPA